MERSLAWFFVDTMTTIPTQTMSNPCLSVSQLLSCDQRPSLPCLKTRNSLITIDKNTNEFLWLFCSLKKKHYKLAIFTIRYKLCFRWDQQFCDVLQSPGLSWDIFFVRFKSLTRKITTIMICWGRQKSLSIFCPAMQINARAFVIFLVI